MSANGTQISDMTDSLTDFPDGSFVPFIVTDPATGLSTRLNYRYDAGAKLAKNSALAATSGAARIGSDDGSSGSLWTTVAGFITYLLSSAGSSILGFIQAGVGAVLRTMQDKARDIISAKDFGALGDGAADDTVAIQAMFDAAEVGDWLYFPGGVYIISDELTISVNRITISGKAVIKAKDGTNFEYLMHATGRLGVTVRDLEFDANKDGRTSGQNIRFMGLGFDACTDCIADNVKVSGARGYNGGSAVGITMAGGSIRCKIIGCQANNCGDITIPATASDGFFTSGEQNLIIGCSATNCTDTGAVVENSNQSGIVGGTYRLCGVGIGITAAENTDKSGNYATGFTVHNWDGSVGAVQVGVPDGGTPYSGNLLHTVVSDFVVVAESVPTYGSPGPAFKIVGQAAGGKVDGLAISDFRIRGSDTQGIAVVYGDNVKISDGYITQTDDACIQFDDGQGHEVTDCRLIGGSYGVITRNDAECVATDNKMRDQTIAVLRAEDTSRLAHRGNRFLSGTGGITTGGTGIIPGSLIALTYGTTVAIDATLGPNFVLTVTNGTGFAVAAPSGGRTGDTIILTIKNTSGGAMGAVTWNAAFALATFTSPATTFNRTITFKLGGGIWTEISRTAADVPN